MMETEAPPHEEHQQHNGNASEQGHGGGPQSPRDVTVKNVYIYRNGDPFYRPHRFTVNNKQVRNYESFLTQVTTTIKPAFGCVRKLTTPDHGHRVKDLDTLEPGKAYVACGIESFAKLPYKEIPDKEVKASPRITKKITPVYHSRIQASARARKPQREPLTIFVYENGNGLKGASRVLLKPREMGSWEQVLAAVSDRVVLPSKGAVRMLYTVGGTRVSNVTELKSGENYVAVAGDGKLIQADYGTSKKPINTSPKLDRKRYERLELDGLKSKTSRNKGGGGAGARPQRGGQKMSTSTNSDDPFRNGGSQATGSRGSQRNNKTRQTNYDGNNDGTFKSKQTNGEGAREVEDGADTKVDLPIDQVEAEEVQDDETDKNNGNVDQDKAPHDNETPRRDSNEPVIDEQQLTKQPSNVNKNVNNDDRAISEERIEVDEQVAETNDAEDANREEAEEVHDEEIQETRDEEVEKVQEEQREAASRATNRGASRASNVEKSASRASRASNAERSASRASKAERSASRASNVAKTEEQEKAQDEEEVVEQENQEAEGETAEQKLVDDQAPAEATSEETQQTAEEEEKERQKRAKAALRIQATYRGHRVRKDKKQ